MENPDSISEFRRVRSIKSQNFQVEKIGEYALSVLVGIRDVQICVTDQQNEVLFFEDLRLEGVRTVKERVVLLDKIWESHSFLTAGFWKNIRIGVKTHKYTLVPSATFSEDSQSDYLAVNSELKPTMESVYHDIHDSIQAANVFAIDKKFVSWIEKTYQNKEIRILHQGSAFIEGVLQSYPENRDAEVFGMLDRGILHLIVVKNKQLQYYNQFATKKSEELLKYSMLVYKELELSQKVTPITLWGSFKADTSNLDLLKKYIKNVRIGDRPKKVSFKWHQLDDLPDHQYFDLFNIQFL